MLLHSWQHRRRSQMKYSARVWHYQHVDSSHLRSSTCAQAFGERVRAATSALAEDRALQDLGLLDGAGRWQKQDAADLDTLGADQADASADAATNWGSLIMAKVAEPGRGGGGQAIGGAAGGASGWQARGVDAAAGQQLAEAALAGFTSEMRLPGAGDIPARIGSGGGSGAAAGSRQGGGSVGGSGGFRSGAAIADLHAAGVAQGSGVAGGDAVMDGGVSRALPQQHAVEAASHGMRVDGSDAVDGDGPGILDLTQSQAGGNVDGGSGGGIPGSGTSMNADIAASRMGGGSNSAAQLRGGGGASSFLHSGAYPDSKTEEEEDSLDMPEALSFADPVQAAAAISRGSVVQHMGFGAGDPDMAIVRERGSIDGGGGGPGRGGGSDSSSGGAGAGQSYGKWVDADDVEALSGGGGGGLSALDPHRKALPAVPDDSAASLAAQLHLGAAAQAFWARQKQRSDGN